MRLCEALAGNYCSEERVLTVWIHCWRPHRNVIWTAFAVREYMLANGQIRKEYAMSLMFPPWSQNRPLPKGILPGIEIVGKLEICAVLGGCVIWLMTCQICYAFNRSGASFMKNSIDSDGQCALCDRRSHANWYHISPYHQSNVVHLEGAGRDW